MNIFPKNRRHKYNSRKTGRKYTNKNNSQNFIVNVELESEVNELFAKTKVIQKLTNPLNNPLELKIYVYKRKGLIFSSFIAKIGDSITVKSKVIKKEKAEEKYTDSLAKGNAAIFVCEDPDDENRIIINMGNIPSKEEITFTSEYLNLIGTSKSYEFELFRNLPIFEGNGIFYQNSKLEGTILIKTKNKNWMIKKEILMDNLKIEKEEYKNKERTIYCIKYKIDNLPNFKGNNLDYIPSSKIYFDIDDDEKPIAYRQKSSFDKNEQNYFIQYKIKRNIEEENKLEETPALFIFLIDQSGSMSGSSIKIAANALKLFIQSLPAKSYYQIIGFGSNYRKYDNVPKEYTQKNIDESIKIIEGLKADLGGTDIYSPLKFIYDTVKNYENINLPKNIFLLTDGEIINKDETLKLIEKNRNNFSVYSIGIGNSFDKDLIKNAGILGGGNYNFCKKLDELNSVIASEITEAISPYISKINIETSLDEKDTIKFNKIQNIIRKDEIINLNYVTNDEKSDNIKIDINYLENDKQIKKTFDITPIEIPEGEEFSKLIYNNLLNSEKLLNEKEKMNLALKYQIFTKNTSLFAEIELSEKVSSQMKSLVIDNKQKNNYLLVKKEHYYRENKKDFRGGVRLRGEGRSRSRSRERPFIKCKKVVYSGQGKARKIMKAVKGINIRENYDEVELRERSADSDSEQEEKKELKKNIKDDVMKIINTQNFIEGFWSENEQTKKIKIKYKKEYDLIKKLNNNKINDNVAMTVIIIYFIYKEHSYLLKELSRIIKKAKLFIKKETQITYDNIIKDIGIN